MASVESVAEAVKKRVRSTSKTRAPAAKRTKTTLEGLSSPSQTPPSTGRSSKAPAAASVFGQAPFEGEPPLSHATTSQTTSALSQATSVLSQTTSALSQVALPVLEHAAQNQPSILSDPVAPPTQADWIGEGEDSASEHSFSPPPPRIPDFRQELDNFKSMMRAEHRETAARQEHAFQTASDRLYTAQQDQFAQLQQLLLQQVHYQQQTGPNPHPALPTPTQSTDLPRWEYEEQDYLDWMSQTREATRSPYRPAPSDAPTKERSRPSLGSLGIPWESL